MKSIAQTIIRQEDASDEFYVLKRLVEIKQYLETYVKIKTDINFSEEKKSSLINEL